MGHGSIATTTRINAHPCDADIPQLAGVGAED